MANGYNNKGVTKSHYLICGKFYMKHIIRNLKDFVMNWKKYGIKKLKTLVLVFIFLSSSYAQNIYLHLGGIIYNLTITAYSLLYGKQNSFTKHDYIL